MFLIIDTTSSCPSACNLDNGPWVFMTSDAATTALQSGNRDSTGEYDIVEVSSNEGCAALVSTLIGEQSRLTEMQDSVEESYGHAYHAAIREQTELVASLWQLAKLYNLRVEAERKAEIDARNEAAVDAYDPNRGCDSPF